MRYSFVITHWEKKLGYDLSFIEPISDIQRRYAAVKRYFSQFGHFQQQSFEGGGQNHRDCRAQRLTTESIRLENAERWNTRAIFQKKKYKRPGELQSGERRNCIAQIAIPRATAIHAEKFGGAIFKHYIKCA